MKNCKDEVLELLKEYNSESILITSHARIRMIQRQISEKEVLENIINPKRLEFSRKEKETKYDCYFVYSKTQCHRYVLVFQDNIIVVTVIKINRQWQLITEKKSKV